MPTLLQDIKSKDWQISTVGVGYVAEGLADIRQCLDILLRTVKGSDPLRYEFGSDISQYLDKPLTLAIPNVKRSIIEAVDIWERRVRVKEIKHEIVDYSTVNFFVVFSLVDEELIDMLKVQIKNGSLIIDDILVGSLVLTALFPPNPNNKRYNIVFVTNGMIMMPTPPMYGFATILEMYQWMVANWSGYGTWILQSDKILGYLPANQYSSASIAVVLVGVVKFVGAIPEPAPGQTFTVTAALDGVTLTKTGLANLSNVLLWAQSNWPLFGNWAIEGFGSLGGDFVDDYLSEDFDTGTPPNYVLALYSSTVNIGVLTITAV